MCTPLSYPRTGQLINADSSLVFDTCGVKYPTTNCDSSFWDNTGWRYYPESMTRVYAKKYWEVRFDVPAIPLDSAGEGVLLYVTHKAIDSINFPDIKNGFKLLESQYGPYRLRKVNPEASSGEESQYFNLYFVNYVPMGEVWYTLDTMEHVYCEFQGWPAIHAGSYVPDQSHAPFSLALNTDNTNLHISSNAEPIINYAIYNLQGNSISHSNNINYQNTLDIDISALSNGIYFLRINTHFSKFIINR
jgi:hypothetical protein